jgi:hypothetical protein
VENFMQENIMKQAREKLQLRQIGKGFIVHNQGSIIVGRRLTNTYKDQYDRTYVKIDGEIEPLTEQHNYLAVD